MRLATLALCLMAFPAASAEAPQTTADEDKADARPLSAAQCLDPERARGWSLLDSSTVYVDAGRRRYLIDLDFACPELGYARSISFRSGGGIGRICGNAGEYLVPDTGLSPSRDCRIGKVRLIPRSAPRQRTNEFFLQARTQDGFFQHRRGDEGSSYDVSRRHGD
jgi:hypothetical protein